MKHLQILTAPEQTAKYLREELEAGRWRQVMPGEDRLITELGIGRHTVKAALKQLEKEGLLVSQGPGRQRKVTVHKKSKRRYLRIKILLYEQIDRGLLDNAALLAQLQEAGYSVDYATKSLWELGMNADRVARHVEKHPADAWVIKAGSREVLEWFSEQSVPAIACYGRFVGLRIAASSPRVAPAMRDATQRLIELGHQRIVMLSRQERRHPKPALIEQQFLDDLKAHGLPVGSYNLPDWKDNVDGFQDCLEKLFRHTPPTALIIAEPAMYFAAQQFLANRGIVAPKHISLICADFDSLFRWSKPMISHVVWDYKPVTRRILLWADNVANGVVDHRQFFTRAKWIEGGTVGPCRPPL